MCVDNQKLIALIQVITHTGIIPGETVIWQQLLDEGADSILVRKPGWQEADYEMLLLQASASCYSRLMIADHAPLCGRFGLQGLHLSEIARGSITDETFNSYKEKGWVLSTGIHSPLSLHLAGNTWDQLLLSPIFNSISKKGYLSGFDAGFRLDKDGYDGHVLALGGINDKTANKARDMQFDGIALLGAIWEEPALAVRNFCRIRDIWRTNILT